MNGVNSWVDSSLASSKYSSFVRKQTKFAHSFLSIIRCCQLSPGNPFDPVYEQDAGPACVESNLVSSGWLEFLP
jgi:hypothetical protein